MAVKPDGGGTPRAGENRLERSVSDDLSRAARVVKADRLRLPQNVKVIRPSDIRAMVDRIVVEISSAEQAQTVSRIAQMEMTVSNLQNGLAKLQSERDALAALVKEKDSLLSRMDAAASQERERRAARLASLGEQLSLSAESARQEDVKVKEFRQDIESARERLRATRSQLEGELAALRRGMESAWNARETEASQARAKLEEVHARHAEELAAARRESASTRDALEAQIQEMRSEVAELRQRHAAELEALEERRAGELAEAKRRLETAIREQEESAGRAREALEAGSQQTLAQSRAAHEKELDTLRKALENEQTALQDEKRKLEERFDCELRSQRDSDQAELARVLREKDALESELRGEIAALQARLERETIDSGAEKARIEESHRTQLEEMSRAAQEESASLRRQMDAAADTARAEEKNLRVRYEDALARQEREKEALRAQFEKEKQDAGSLHEQGLSEARAQAKETASALERSLEELAGRNKALEEQLSSLGQSLDAKAGEAARLRAEVEAATGEIARREELLAGVQAQGDARLSQEAANARAHAQEALAHARRLAEHKEAIRDFLVRAAAALEALAAALARDAAALKASSSRAGEMGEGLKKRIEELSRGADSLRAASTELVKSYQQQHGALAAMMDNLKAGLSFAAVHPVRDWPPLVGLAQKTCRSLDALKTGPHPRIVECMSRVVGEAGRRLEEERQRYEGLFSRAAGRQADIETVVELMKAEQMARFCGSLIEKVHEAAGADG